MKKPIVLPVPFVLGSARVCFQIFPDASVRLVPPRPAVVIPIDRKPSSTLPEPRSKFVLRALKTLSPEVLRLLWSAKMASQEGRETTTDEVAAVRSFLTALAREYRLAGLSIDAVLMLIKREPTTGSPTK